MIVLKPISTAQTLKFIARQDNATHIILRDEQDNTSVQIDATFTLDSYYLTTDILFNGNDLVKYIIRVENDNGTFITSPCIETYETSNVFEFLKEDRFYNLTVYNNTDIMYKDKIFCTSQTDYSINNDSYIQRETNNDYITL